VDSEKIKKFTKDWYPLIAIFGVVIGISKVFFDSYNTSDIEGKMLLLALLNFAWTTFVFVAILLRIAQKKSK
jgi:hypothetical protein